MKSIKTTTAFAALFFSLVPAASFANISYSPWVHEIVQSGADMEVTVSVFDETTWTNDAGLPLPGLEAAYTLERLAHEDYALVFENRVFKPEEADEVTDYMCHNWTSWGDDCTQSECTDCNGDGVGDCYGFCGVAYRYKVIDVCPKPEQDVLYQMYASQSGDLYAYGKDSGFTSAYVQDVGIECREEQKTGCSVSEAGRRTPITSLLLNAIFVMIPL